MPTVRETREEGFDEADGGNPHGVTRGGFRLLIQSLSLLSPRSLASFFEHTHPLPPLPEKGWLKLGCYYFPSDS